MDATKKAQLTELLKGLTVVIDSHSDVFLVDDAGYEKLCRDLQQVGWHRAQVEGFRVKGSYTFLDAIDPEMELECIERKKGER